MSNCCSLRFLICWAMLEADPVWSKVWVFLFMGFLCVYWWWCFGCIWLGVGFFLCLLLAKSFRVGMTVEVKMGKNDFSLYFWSCFTRNDVPIKEGFTSEPYFDLKLVIWVDRGNRMLLSTRNPICTYNVYMRGPFMLSWFCLVWWECSFA